MFEWMSFIVESHYGIKFPVTSYCAHVHRVYVRKAPSSILRILLETDFVYSLRPLGFNLQQLLSYQSILEWSSFFVESHIILFVVNGDCVVFSFVLPLNHSPRLGESWRLQTYANKPNCICYCPKPGPYSSGVVVGLCLIFKFFVNCFVIYNLRPYIFSIKLFCTFPVRDFYSRLYGILSFSHSWRL